MKRFIKIIKNFIMGFVKRIPFLRKIAYKLKIKVYGNMYEKATKKYKVDSKCAIFESFNGKKYCDSPMAIFLEMQGDERFKDFTFYWAFKEPEKFKYLEADPRTKVITYETKEYYEAYAKAKYWFTPSKLPGQLKPSDEQVYVQFWHGTPLKRLGFDIEVESENAILSKDEWTTKYLQDAKRYKYMIAPSRFAKEKFISAFGLEKINKQDAVIETGYPRNDQLFTYTDEYVNKLKEELGIPKDKKIILYAPTWRDNQYKTGVGYSYKVTIDFDKFRELFSDEYVILFRTHYLVCEAIDVSKYKGFIYNLSDYSNINDLYILSDLIITDYSSVFFDYANLKRPMIFYMYDLAEYQGKMRDFYIDLNTLPGPIVTEEEDLYKAIKNIDSYWNEYGEKYKEFNDKYNYLDGPDSSKKVLDIVIER